MSFHGAIFDLDGTLVDSMWVFGDLLPTSLHRRQIACEQELVDTIKNMTFQQSAEYVTRRFDLDISPEQLMEEWNGILLDHYRNDLVLKAGAAEYIRRLHNQGVRLCVATSNFREACEAVLQSNGILDCFAFILISDEVGQNKTKPDIYIESARRLGCKPADCMVFEDILAGIRSAKGAGMQVTGVYDPSSEADTEEIKKWSDRYIVSFQELLI